MLLERLQKHPEEFNFFQAIRLLENDYYHKFSSGKDPAHLVAEDTLIDTRNLSTLNLFDDFVRFSASSHHAYPIGSIETIKFETAENTEITIPKVLVKFLGLTGINAGLPASYTDKISYLIHEQNLVIKDFFDIFNHLFILLYYQAWKRSHFFMIDFRSEEKNNHHNTFNMALLGIAGDLSQNQLREEIDKVCLNYASLFAGHQRSSIVLESLLQEYFKLPIKVLQLQGKWLVLQGEDKTMLGTPKGLVGRYQKLGTEIILGTRYWNIDCHFRIYIGPIHYKKFQELHPSKNLFKFICEVIKRYSKPGQSFDIQFELIATEVPYCVLRLQNPMQLGWNTWLKAEPMGLNSNAVVVKPL